MEYRYPLWCWLTQVVLESRPSNKRPCYLLTDVHYAVCIQYFLYPSAVCVAVYTLFLLQSPVKQSAHVPVYTVKCSSAAAVNAWQLRVIDYLWKKLPRTDELFVNIWNELHTECRLEETTVNYSKNCVCWKDSEPYQCYWGRQLHYWCISVSDHNILQLHVT